MMSTLRRIALHLEVDVLMGVGIQEIDRGGVFKSVYTTSGLKLKCKNIVIATNAFAPKILPELKVKPGRAQVLITSEIPNLNWSGTFHLDQGYFYFRNVGKRVLFGGGRHLFREAETTYDQTITEEVQTKLDQILREIILPKKEYQIEHRWAGTLGLGENRLPICEKLEPGLFAGVKMGGMGVAIGSLIGKELATMVLNET
jgi:gamma-glutamylputrescine oxidase